MPKKTQRYQLNQYEPQDSFLRTDFNEDNAKIDAALAGKAEVVAGTYTGSGAASRTVALGFRPKAVLVFPQDGVTRADNLRGGLALDGHPCLRSDGNPVVEVADAGFSVYCTKISASNSINSNEASRPYHYLALR